VRQVWGAKPDKRGIALAQMLDESRPWRPVSSLAISIVTARSECAGVAYERFPALRGDAMPSDLARYFPVDVALSPGEIGRYASHLAILQRVARGDLASPPCASAEAFEVLASRAGWRWVRSTLPFESHQSDCGLQWPAG
jgi:hypothetical protein